MDIFSFATILVHLVITLVTIRITTMIIEDVYPMIELNLSSLLLVQIPFDLLLFTLYMILGLVADWIGLLTRSYIVDIVLVIIVSTMISVSLILDRYFERPRLWRFVLIGVVQLSVLGIYFNPSGLSHVFCFLAATNLSIIIFFTFGQKGEIITHDEKDFAIYADYEQSIDAIFRRDDFFGFLIKYDLGCMIFSCDKHQLKKTIITVSILIGVIGKIIIDCLVIGTIGYSMILIGSIMFGAGIGLVLAGM